MAEQPPPYDEKMVPPPQQTGYGYDPPSQPVYAPPPQQGYPPAQPGYPPAQPGYPAAHPAQATTVTVVNANPHLYLRDVPVAMQCQYCGAHTTTYLTMNACSGLAWLIFAILFVLGWWLCSFIPFCIPSCHDCEHHCSNCQRIVGTYKRL